MTTHKLVLIIHLWILLLQSARSLSPLPSGAQLVETETRKGFPLGKDFDVLKPLLMNKAAEAGPLGQLPDHLLAALPQAFVTFVNVQQRDLSGTGQDVSIRKFLLSYEDGKTFVDQHIPTLIKSVMGVPKMLQCDAVTIAKTRLLMRQGGNWDDSPVRDVNQHRLDCLLSNGPADILLFNTSSLTTWEEFLSSSQSLDSLTSYHKVQLKAGDCLSVPRTWISRSWTEGRVLMFSLYWETTTKEANKGCNKFDPEMTLERANCKEDPHENIFQLISMHSMGEFIEKYYLRANMTRDSFRRQFKKDPKISQLSAWDEECQENLNELFEDLDQDSDQMLTTADLDSLESKEELLHLSGLLEDKMADFQDILDDQQEDSRTQDKRSKLGLVKGLTGDYEKELQKVLEDGFNEIFQDMDVPGSIKFDVDGKPSIVLKPKTAEENKEQKTSETSDPIDEVIVEDARKEEL